MEKLLNSLRIKSKFKIGFIFFLLLLGLKLKLPTVVFAHCPLCVAGAGVGLSLAATLGIDDSITGVWVAALIGATALLSARIIRKRVLPAQTFVVYLGFFILTVWSFYQFNLINLHAGNIAGLPKLVFGIVAGAVVFWLVDNLNKTLIKKTGRVFFPYQGIIILLGSILFLSAFIFILINYYI